jgi:hypothetical protein
MFDDVGSNQISSEAQNAPNLAFAANPILGNVEFNVQAPQAQGTTVQPGYPTFPYIAIESLIFFQMMDNPNQAPYTTLSGGTSGQQVIQGQYTINDSNGNTQMVMGYQQNGFA